MGTGHGIGWSYIAPLCRCMVWGGMFVGEMYVLMQHNATSWDVCVALVWLYAWSLSSNKVNIAPRVMFPIRIHCDFCDDLNDLWCHLRYQKSANSKLAHTLCPHDNCNRKLCPAMSTASTHAVKLDVWNTLMNFTSWLVECSSSCAVVYTIHIYA